MPLKILVDCRGCRRKGSGVGRMIVAIVGELCGDGRFAFTVVTDAPEVWAAWPDVRCLPTGRGGRGWTEDGRLRWEQCRLRRIIRRERPDVYWAPWNHGVPWLCRAPAVLTVHDVIPLRHADAFGSRLRRMCYRASLWLSLRAAKRIVAVSEATRRELAERCGADPGRVTVIRHGVEPRFSPEDEAGDADFGLSGRVVLYVGGCEPRKNLARLLASFDAVASWPGLEDVALAVTADRERLDGGARSALEAMAHADRVRLLGYVPDERLPGLYRRASVFAFPTLEEGFGFPPLEAMACGVPVVASAVDSLPEVVGAAAVVVDPNDISALAGAIVEVLTDGGRAAEMSRRGREQAARFSWPDAAQAMGELFVECAEG